MNTSISIPRRQALALAFASAGLCGPALAQSFNIDIGSNTAFPTPADIYGAASGQVGRWNAVDGAAAAAALVDLTGAATGVVLGQVGGAGNFGINNVGTLGDDQNLMDDIQNVGGAGAATTWTFDFLGNGLYTVFTYAWAPDNAAFFSNVTVNCSSDSGQNVGGAWGPWAVGTTHALHHVLVRTSTLVVNVATAAGAGSVNGIQIIRETSYSGVPLCFGDGTGNSCPCGNFGALGHGCENSFATGGGLLAAGGAPIVANDHLVMFTAFLPPVTSVLLLQGTDVVSAGLGTINGDGLLCVGGAVLRLGVRPAACGQATWPGLGEVPLSVRGAIPAAGATRLYQAYYRNAAAAFCTPALYNFTQGLQITWVP